MKPTFSSLGIPENGLGVLFSPQITSYIEENKKKISRIRQTRKCLLSRTNGKQQPTNVENGGKIMVTWSLLNVRVSRKPDAKSLSSPEVRGKLSLIKM